MGLRRTGAGAAIAAVLVATSCGGSSGLSGGATVSGQVSGGSIPTTSVVGFLQMQQPGVSSANVTAVVMTNLQGACGVLQRVADGGAAPGDTTALVVSVATTGAFVPAGTYAITGTSCAPNCPSTQVSAAYSMTDKNCNTAQSLSATAGSVVFSSVTSTEITGNFDVTFASGDHVTGSFTAPLCDLGTVQMGARACF